MGILDVIKRWFGGGKPAPAKPSPTSRNYQPSAPADPAPKPSQPTPPAPLSAHEALDELAAKAAAKSGSAFTERRERPRVNARDGTRVLIIDDSPTIVALLKRMLEQNGYATMEAVDAETGVALAISEKPDLIFLDIVLPGMNGFEALRRLRRDAATKVVPIVMISGNELATEQFYAQRIGADDFMKKPFSRSEVFARIEKLLDAEKVPRRHLAVVKPVPSVDGATAPAAAAPVAPAAVAPAVVAPAAPPAPAAPVLEAAVAAAAPAAAPVPEAAPVAAPVAATVDAAPTEAPAALIETAAQASVATETVAIAVPATESAPVAQAAESAAETDSSQPSAANDAGEPAVVAIETTAETAAAAAPDAMPDPVPSASTAASSATTDVVDAIAAPSPAASADPSKTLAIEETLRAPANDDARDQAPMPLAAVASTVAPSPAFAAGDAVSEPVAAVASMPPSQASAQHTVSG